MHSNCVRLSIYPPPLPQVCELHKTSPHVSEAKDVVCASEKVLRCQDRYQNLKPRLGNQAARNVLKSPIHYL